MKTAVYAIALNEEQFVERWYESAKEADYLLIADTGSQDGTIALAKSLGINVISVGIRPWRFDDARNASLAAIPLDVDYCIALDLDEVLLPGWKAELEKAHNQGWTRPRYQYTWSWADEEKGLPGLQYGGDKIHTRKNYRWKHPVHEVLRVYGSEEVQGWTSLEIQHHPDNSKSRGQYFPLLELAVNEDPDDDRTAFYYARELYFNQMYDKAIAEFKRHLSLPKAVWKPERAASLRYLAKCDLSNATSWLKQAVAEDPNRREARLELAMQYYGTGHWNGVFVHAEYCLTQLTEKPLDYLCEEFAWGALPYDLGALSAYHLGKTELALEWGAKAVELDPTNERLQRNLGFYQAN